MLLKIRLDLENERIQRLLLTGLDSWVQLGLLSEKQVKEIATELSRPLPATRFEEVKAIKAPPILEKPTLIPEYSSPAWMSEASTAPYTEQPATSPKRQQSRVTQTTTKSTTGNGSWLSGAIASLVEEISVIWLLLLGVFLVILSSSVLAASQWDSFTAVGQYGILLAYTLAFWAASFWTQKQANLQSTGRMLALTAILLIPINFWVMDRFGLFSSASGIGMAIVAAIALSALPLGLSNKLMPRRTNQLNLIGLSWLHLGWTGGWTGGLIGGWGLLPGIGWPVIATYLGTICTTANLTAQHRQTQNHQTQNRQTQNGNSNTETKTTRQHTAGLSFDQIPVAFAIAIFLIRSLWLTQLPLDQLGLAAGICGWLLVKPTRFSLRQRTDLEDTDLGDTDLGVTDLGSSWVIAGFGLMLLGWLVSITGSPPLQAIAISLLALHRLWQYLHQSWKPTYLVAGLGVSLQTYCLIWSVLPSTFRDRLLTWLSTWVQVGTIEPLNWAGIGLFPYLLGMLGFAAYLRRHPQAAIAHNHQNQHSDYPDLRLDQLTEQLALALGFLFALTSFGHPFTSAINLSLSSLTLILILWKRQLQPSNLVALAHGVSLLTIVSWIHYSAPELSTANWAKIMFSGAIAELIIHLTPYNTAEINTAKINTAKINTLKNNTWYGGLTLSALSYGLLIDSHSQHPNWLWLIIPIILTVIANSRFAAYPETAAAITIGALSLQLPWIETWPIAITSFAIATLCLGINSRILPNLYTALLTIATALLFIGTLVWHHLLDPLNNSDGRLLIFWVIITWSVWLIHRGLTHPGFIHRRLTHKRLSHKRLSHKRLSPSASHQNASPETSSSPETSLQETPFPYSTIELTRLYASASQIWGVLLMVSYLLWITTFTITSSIETSPLAETLATSDTPETTYLSYALAATIILITALIELIRHQPTEWRYWSLAWAAEIALIIGLSLQDASAVIIGVATLAFAFAIEIGTDLWVKVKQSSYRDSWHSIPIALSGIELFLGHLEFQADSGFFTLATGLIFIGIGRRDRPFNGSAPFFSYTGLAACSIGAYELLSYQLSQASGGSFGDGITLLAALAFAIALLYRACRNPITQYVKTSTQAIGLIGYAHWALGSLLCFTAALEGLSQPQGIALWTLCSVLFSVSAISSGNRHWNRETIVFNHTLWTWIGFIGSGLCFTYNRYVWFPDRTLLLSWSGPIACIIGIALYYSPWEKWGWPSPESVSFTLNEDSHNDTNHTNNASLTNPWRLLGQWLPLFILSLTFSLITTQGLLLIAGFYAWLAKQQNNIRLSYLSIGLLDFTLFDYFDLRNWLTPTTVGIIIGLSILYFAEVEPALKDDDSRQQKHLIRTLASSIIGLSALYQTEISEPFLFFAALTLILSILLIFAGLILKVRAFLYVGTATFIAQIIRVLWLFISANSLLLWAVGIVLGLIFIWIAATFESRRSQLSTQISSWTTALESWE